MCISPHLPFSISLQRDGPVLLCLTANSLRPQLLFIITSKTCLKVSFGKLDFAKTVKKTMLGEWPTQREERASAKRRSDSLEELWQRKIRRWLSKQNQSLAMTSLCFRSSLQGQMLHMGYGQAIDCYEKCIDNPHGDNKNDLSSETLVNALRCASKSGSYNVCFIDKWFNFQCVKVNELTLNKWLDMSTSSLCTYVTYPLALWIPEMQR